MALVAALCVIVGVVLEFGFALSERLQSEFDLVYFWAWNMFLLERVCHLALTKRGQRKSAFSFLGWILNGLLTLTLIPIVLNLLGIDDGIGVIRILENRAIYLLVLFLISSIELSDAVITSLGRKSNPALMMAVSFLFIIMVGSGMLLMPRCIQQGVHLSWIDSLFTATSAVCVTGLTTIDVPGTFTCFGQLVIMMLIQVGGLGVMTITSFFALFFMGNTSIYNQMQVQDMVSSKSLASLWSTLLNIFGFTAFLELAGAVMIFLNIHGTIGLDFRHELFFSVFHAVSAFCNGGFSNYQDGVGASVLMEGHCWLYIILALLIILGGIGYPVLVNLKTAVAKHSKVLWKRSIFNGQWSMFNGQWSTILGYYGSALLIGLGNGHMWPAFQNMTINVAPNNQRGTANSTILISWDIGMGLGILVGGVVSELIGYSAAFWTVVFVNASGVACFFLATKAFFLRRNMNETVR